jgi:hypothetical protein
MVFENDLFWDIKTVRTSQETHYVSATEPSRLMLCEIWGFHGGDYEECRLLGCDAVWPLYELTFRRNVSPPSSGWQVGELGTTSTVTRNWSALRKSTDWSDGGYVPTKRRFLKEPHGVTPHSHSPENLKSYIIIFIHIICCDTYYSSQKVDEISNILRKSLIKIKYN